MKSVSILAHMTQHNVAAVPNVLRKVIGLTAFVRREHRAILLYRVSLAYVNTMKIVEMMKFVIVLIVSVNRYATMKVVHQRQHVAANNINQCAIVHRAPTAIHMFNVQLTENQLKESRNAKSMLTVHLNWHALANVVKIHALNLTYARQNKRVLCLTHFRYELWFVNVQVTCTPMRQVTAFRSNKNNRDAVPIMIVPIMINVYELLVC